MAYTQFTSSPHTSPSMGPALLLLLGDFLAPAGGTLSLGREPGAGEVVADAANRPYVAEVLRIGLRLADDVPDVRDAGGAGLALSGVAAGLNISFSALALGVVGAMAGGVGLVAMLFYPIGFLIVVLGRAQLFTENTVTGVTVALTEASKLLNMLRFWAVVFASNVIGAAVFAAAVTYGNLLDPAAFDLLLEGAAHNLEPGFLALTLKVVFGGWLVALVAWLVAACQATISQAFSIYVLSFLIPAARLAQCVAGSAEVLMSVFAGETAFLAYLFGFLAPATLGNTIGGVVLVTLLNFGQVVGSDQEHLPNADADL
ncbi:MAG: formate/nitrite transporter family protein [Actinomycetota bacterium]|nr:formate/nitrite transporter family protein [Actinomycetota bacterium]